MSRFIPACAGNTLSQGDSRYRSSGSSPPVRGTPRPLAPPVAHRAYRFIPACAGNTTSRADRTVGADQRFIPACAGNTARTNLGITGGYQRFIPACAGNTSLERRLATVAWPVHPRLCGEHDSESVSRSCSNRIIAGSSPPVRGTPRHRLGHCLAFDRFIPACAGNT